MAGSLEPARPAVSVVIATIGRPDLVIRAVRSALDQSVSEAEVVVVVDGPDDTTIEALAKIEDRRLRVWQLAENGGLGAAISAGVAQARAPWVALLDDDDEWLPRKLEVQLAHARRSRSAHPIVACHFIARTGAGDLTWPRRHPEPREPLSEYFFCQRGLRGGEGVVLPSSIMTTRALLERVPFRVGLPRLNDYDWLLRAARADGAALEFVALDDPLVIYHRDESRDRLSTSADWQYCRTWIRENRDLVTQRAWVGFLLTVASMTAARSGEKKAFFVLLWDAFRHGRPSSVDLMAHLTIWLIPWTLRTRVAVGLGAGGPARDPRGRRGSREPKARGLASLRPSP